MPKPKIEIGIGLDLRYPDGRIISYIWTEVEGTDDEYPGWECWRRADGQSHRLERLDRLSTAGVHTIMERIRDHPEDPPT